LVKSSATLYCIGFAQSLVKRVSLNFFCKWKSLKKALLGLWQLGGNSVGKAGWEAAI
jgi:hypothetical protein